MKIGPIFLLRKCQKCHFSRFDFLDTSRLMKLNSRMKPNKRRETGRVAASTLLTAGACQLGEWLTA